MVPKVPPVQTAQFPVPKVPLAPKAPPVQTAYSPVPNPQPSRR